MEVTYRRDGEHNYMIWKAPGDLQGSEYQVRMLLVNEIPGLLRCRIRNVDGAPYLYYEITSRQPLARIFEHRAAGYEDIRALIQAVSRTLEGIARYLLPDSGLLLEPEFLYMDLETKEVSFCYLPCGQADIPETFRSLAEYLLKNLDHEDERAVLWGYHLYSGTVEENYSVNAVLLSLQGKLEKGRERKIEEKPDVKTERKKSDDSKSRKIQYVPNKEKEKIPVQRMLTGQEQLKKKEKRWKTAGMVLAALLCIAAAAGLGALRILTLTQAGGILFLAAGVLYYLCVGKKEGKEKNEKGQKQKKTGGKERKKLELVKQDSGWQERETKRPEEYSTPEPQVQEEIIEEEICDFKEDPEEEFYGQTTLLGGGVTGDQPVLISSQPEARANVIIDKEKFIIGKLKGQVDLALNLPVISRMHAGIERREEGFFLVDLNSTNGTYLNGERLEANEYRQLHTGDEIIFAGAGYYFKE